jgi:hypothetical protein
MTADTANWQSETPKLTMKQAAAVMNVSERSVYRAKELIATGREDLADEIMAGRLTLLGALKIAKPEKYGAGRNYQPGADKYAALVKAWNNCDEDERARFIGSLRSLAARRLIAAE